MNTVERLLASPFSRLSHEEKLQVKRLGPDRPDLQLQQSSLDRGKTYTRKFSNSWYTKCDWLTANPTTNSLFCFPCLLYGGDGEVPWTKKGVTDLKHLSDKISKHAHTTNHLENLTRLGMLGDTPIVAHLSDAYRKTIKAHNEAVDRNRHILSKIIDCIRFCGAFELALRGHDESDSSSNPGIFRRLVDLIASIDREMEAHLASATVFKGTSKTVQNEHLECMLGILKSYIVQELKDTDFVAIQADDTTDVATKTQCVLVFRYLDKDSQVVERFFGFAHIRDSSAETITSVILRELNTIFPEQSQKKKLIAQSYDGASVMSGSLGGVQTRVRDVHPNAHYVHCYAHQLNLIIQQAVTKIKEAQVFFYDVAGMAAFFSRSPKRTEVLLDCATKRLPKGAQTRWNFHSRTINTIFTHRLDFEKCFDTIEDNDDFDFKSRNEARGYARTLQDREFQFFLFLFHDKMTHVDILYNQLQKRQMDTVFVQHVTAQFVTSMNKIRDGVDNLDNTLPNGSTFSNRRKNIATLVRTAKEICDTITTHATQCFSFTKHLVSATLLQTELFATYHTSFPEQALNEAVDAYPMLIKEDLRNELRVLYSMTVYREVSGAIPLLSLIQKLNMQKSLTETVSLLKILITTPMTTAEAERCFSTLNRIKTFLGNTMLEDRLNALAMLSMERDLIKNIPDFNAQVIEKFEAMKDRRADFVYKK